jgi:hypothetical protein
MPPPPPVVPPPPGAGRVIEADRRSLGAVRSPGSDAMRQRFFTLPWQCVVGVARAPVGRWEPAPLGAVPGGAQRSGRESSNAPTGSGRAGEAWARP